MSDDELHDQAQTALTDLNCTHPDAGITGLRALFKRIGADSPDAEVIKRAIDRLEEIAHEITQVENLLSEAISVSARSRREHPRNGEAQCWTTKSRWSATTTSVALS